VKMQKDSKLRQLRSNKGAANVDFCLKMKREKKVGQQLCTLLAACNSTTTWRSPVTRICHLIVETS